MCSMASETTHGRAMIMANFAKLSPEAFIARRFVRLETGRRSEAELARCAVA